MVTLAAIEPGGPSPPTRLPGEAGSLDAFLARMAQSDANARWQPDMASLMDPLTDANTGFHHRMTEVIHLD